MTTLDPRSDEDLVAAFVAGDSEAFDVLVARYRRRVFGICYRYFGDPEDAEDAAQETFVALLRRAETFTASARFSTWLYRVTTNACNDIARRRSRRPQAAREAPDLAEQPARDDPLAARELALDLREALDTLEPEHREPVLLHDVEGLPYADVAARLGVPVGTVKSRIHRGHARLAQHLRTADRAAGDGPAAEPRDAASARDHVSREPSGATRPPTGQP